MASIFSPRQQANIWIGLEALLGNKIRTLLTALGVVFGVAAVIAMLAIGNGAQQELLEQMKLVGVNNIIIKPAEDKPDPNNAGSSKKDKAATGSSEKKEQKKYSPGLSLADVEAIKVALNGEANLSPEIMLDQAVVAGTKTVQSKTVGVWNAYFDLGQLQLIEGSIFTEMHQATGSQVCVIGKTLKSKLFPGATALGKQIKVGKHWLKVIGVYEFRSAKTSGMEQLGIRDYNLDACIPLKTMLLRYTNRTLVTQSKIKASNGGGDDEDEDGNGGKKESKTIHQLDRLIVQVRQSDLLNASADVCSRLLLRRHNTVLDFEITIPELLLKQQERTKDIFNIVLGAIAGISLLVGGIGIMNIMLASVLERIKEIGLRISLGAKRSDIVMQFLVESTLIACIGGFTGIALGISMAWIVSQVAQIPTVVSPWSVIISFGVAAIVGLGFGIAPARKAASQNPIESLRYE